MVFTSLIYLVTTQGYLAQSRQARKENANPELLKSYHGKGGTKSHLVQKCQGLKPKFRLSLRLCGFARKLVSLNS